MTHILTYLVIVIRTEWYVITLVYNQDKLPVILTTSTVRVPHENVRFLLELSNL